MISTCVTQMGFTGNWTRQRCKKWNCGCMSHQQLMNTSLSRPTGASKMGIGVSRTSIQFGQQVGKAISTMGRHQDMLITTLPGAFSEWSLGSGLRRLEIGQTPCMICMEQVTIP